MPITKQQWKELEEADVTDELILEAVPALRDGRFELLTALRDIDAGAVLSKIIAISGESVRNTLFEENRDTKYVTTYGEECFNLMQQFAREVMQQLRREQLGDAIDKDGTISFAHFHEIATGFFARAIATSADPSAVALAWQRIFKDGLGKTVKSASKLRARDIAKSEGGSANTSEVLSVLNQVTLVMNRAKNILGKELLETKTDYDRLF